jgi:alcohol dehydrogenase/L-iditol 2-dehydrogenase
MVGSMAAVVNYSGEPGSVELREVPVPDIGDEDVLLEVRAVGICGSDVHQWQGSHSWPVNYPCILGHEFGGVVVRRGARVGAFQEGDRVVSETAAVIDPASPLTRAGNYQLDPSRLGFGYGVNGAMTSYVRVPERCLHHVPAELPFEIAALTEPCCVAYSAVCGHAAITPGDDVLVMGPGPIGLLCGAMARLSGAGRVVVSGLASDHRRFQVAREMGLDTVLASDVPDLVKTTYGGLGFDLVVDAAGVSPTLKLAIEVVRPGGTISKVGWGRRPLDFSIDPIVQKAVTLQGSFSHNWPIWERVLRLLGTGQLDVTPLLNRVATLEAWEDCFEKMHACDFVKAVLTPPAGG